MPQNVCPVCGTWDVEKRIVDGHGSWATAVCSTCGVEQPFRRLPLFIISGPSGAGKTTVMHHLIHSLPECVVIESDILWGVIPVEGPKDYTYFDIWLRVAKSIAQAGKPVLLCGTALPFQMEPVPERRYIGDIHYLALTCEPTVLRSRLKARPAWRDSSSDTFVNRCIEFNDWLHANAATTTPPMSLLETSRDSPEQIAAQVRSWVRNRL